MAFGGGDDFLPGSLRNTFPAVDDGIFQITDDLLNETSTEEAMGKPVGNDEEREKMTWVSVFDLEKAKEDAAAAIEKARSSLKGLPGTVEALDSLAGEVLVRTH